MARYSRPDLFHSGHGCPCSEHRVMTGDKLTQSRSRVETAIEQAIATGSPTSAIMRRLSVDYEQVRLVRLRMEVLASC